MWQAVSTELAGWREALTDRLTVVILLTRTLCGALCAALGIVGAGAVGAPAAVLGTAVAVLVGSLAWLRATGE